MFCVLNQFLLTYILVFAPSACTRIIRPLGSFTTCHLVWGSFPATWSQFCCCPFHATFPPELVAVVYILFPAANLSLLPLFLSLFLHRWPELLSWWKTSVFWLLTLFVLSVWLFVANRHKTSPLEIKGTSYCAIEHFPGNFCNIFSHRFMLPSTPAASDGRAGLENFSSQTGAAAGRSTVRPQALVGGQRDEDLLYFILPQFFACLLFTQIVQNAPRYAEVLQYIKPNIWWWCAQAAVSRRPRPAHNYRRFTIVQLWLLPTSRWATLGLAGLFTSLVLILGHPVHFQNRTITSQNSGTMLIFFYHMLGSFWWIWK